MVIGRCFLCGNECKIKDSSQDVKRYNCTICGSYGISRKAEINYENDIQTKRRASIIVMEKTLTDEGKFILCEKTHGLRDGIQWIGIEDFISRYPQNPKEMIDRSLLNLSRMVSLPSDSVKLTLESRSILFSHDSKGMSYILRQLYDMKYINGYNGGIPCEILIELKGWERIGELSKLGSNTKGTTEYNIEKINSMSTPDFSKLKIDPELAKILSFRWEEATKCIQAKAFLCSVIMMGSLLEGLLKAVIDLKPKEANQSDSCPKDSKNGKPKPFSEWTLSEMIEVAHKEDWIGLDVKKFSHSLREFRNLVHPHLQMKLNTYPDDTTSDICWLVVQAAVKNLIQILG